MSKKSKAAAKPFAVYVPEIAPKWHDVAAPGIAAGKHCLYVGETSKEASERFAEHLVVGSSADVDGKKRPAGPFGRMIAANGGRPLVDGEDVILRPDLAERFNTRPPIDRDASERAERRAVVALRKKGHAVYPTKVGSDDIKWSGYKRA